MVLFTIFSSLLADHDAFNHYMNSHTITHDRHHVPFTIQFAPIQTIKTPTQKKPKKGYQIEAKPLSLSSKEANLLASRWKQRATLESMFFPKSKQIQHRKAFNN